MHTVKNTSDVFKDFVFKAKANAFKAKAKDLQKARPRPRPRTWDQGQEILKANTKDIQKPLPQRHITKKNIQGRCYGHDCRVHNCWHSGHDRSCSHSH